MRLRELAHAVLNSRPGIPALGALAARLCAGGIFLGFGMGKFTRHSAEAHSFDRYGLPFPDTFTYLIGVVEVGGGLLLIAGLLVRPAALMLAGNMVGAISTAGVKEGGAVNLGLAPVLLVTMLFLLWAGPGRLALDCVLARKVGAEGAT